MTPLNVRVRVKFESKRPGPDLRYAVEKLRSAVWTLATMNGSLRDRIFQAYLDFSLVGSDLTDPEQIKIYKWLKSTLARRTPTPLEAERIGRLGASLRTMNGVMLSRVASQVCELAHRAEEQLRSQEMVETEKRVMQECRSRSKCSLRALSSTRTKAKGRK